MRCGSRLPAEPRRLIALVRAARAVILAATVAAAALVGTGQAIEVVDEEFFDFIEEVQDLEMPDGAVVPKAGAASTVLHFPDGEQLHGTLASIHSSRQELLWRYPGAAAPLQFPLGQLSRVVFTPTGRIENKARALVKLTGSDWLTGEVVAMRDNQLQLKLPTGLQLSIHRDHLEWIYFSKGPPPECYEGPTSFAGWSSSGGWEYRDGALVAIKPAPIGRRFENLPDQVEYSFQLSQGGTGPSFTVTLHSAQALTRGVSSGSVQLSVRPSGVRLWAHSGGEMKNEQVEIAPEHRPRMPLDPNETRPVRYRVLEDVPRGRLLFFVEGRKVADWTIGKGQPGQNRGSFNFQPLVWNTGAAPVLSNIRVVPWDGRVPAEGDAAEDRSVDVLSSGSGDVHSGRITALAADGVKLATASGTVNLPREKVVLLRFARPANPHEEDPPIARVHLSHRGEFDASALSVKEGRLVARTNFAGELTLQAGQIRELEFLRRAPAAAEPRALLVFENGDRLRGSLEAAAASAPIQWRLEEGSPPITFASGAARGVLYPVASEEATGERVLARFRNGDLMLGELLELSDSQLRLNVAEAGALTIERAQLHTLYFPSNGRLPVLDGGLDRSAWERKPTERKRLAARGTAVFMSGGPVTTPSENVWRYFDGAFTPKITTASGSAAPAIVANSTLSLATEFEAMPENVEISFRAAAGKAPLFLSAQLFGDDSSSGYLIQFHPEGLYIHDTAPRGRGAAVQQQFKFPDAAMNAVVDDGLRAPGLKPRLKVNTALERRLRFVADRRSGRLTIHVDDVLIGTFGGKANEPRKLGTGLFLATSQGNPCTFSDIWIAPARTLVAITKSPKPFGSGAPGAAPEPLATVLLANGDEALGTIRSLGSTALQLDSEVGELELPLKRVTMIHFGDEITRSRAAFRVRTSFGSLSLKSYRVEKGVVTCQPELAEAMSFPASALRELVLAPNR